MGDQVGVDGGAQRWRIVIGTLLAVCGLGPEAQTEFGADTVELHPVGSDGASGLWVPRLLDGSPRCAAAWAWLQQKVLHEMLEGRGRLDVGCPLLGGVGGDARRVIERFVLKPALAQPDIDAFEALVTTLQFGEETVMSLTVLRGLLSHNVVQIGLTKRWRVNYGVDPARAHRRRPTRMAVPFEAKDVAKGATEFGHVDIALVFTVLSYLRSGLDESDLDMLFDAVLKQPQSDEVYIRITADAPTPLAPEFRSLATLALGDRTERRRLYDALRSRRGVVRGFLESVVFPRDVGQFEAKLVATPWDLVSTAKGKAVTGFSGTRDTDMLLPAEVEHRGVPELLATDAQVRDPSFPDIASTCFHPFVVDGTLKAYERVFAY